MRWDFFPIGGWIWCFSNFHVMHNLKICNGFENWHYFAFPLASHIKSSSSFQIKSLKSFIRHKLQYWTANYFLWKYKQICKIICLLSSSHPISVLRLAHGLWRHLYSNRTAALMTHNRTKILMKLYFWSLEWLEAIQGIALLSVGKNFFVPFSQF